MKPARSETLYALNLAEALAPQLMEVPGDGATVSRSGVIAALDGGCTHLLFLDSWSSGNQVILSALVAAARSARSAVILGQRPASVTTTSAARLSDLLIRLETGLRLADAGGPCIYPLDLVQLIVGNRSRGIGQLELLVRAAWARCPMVLLPIAGDRPVSKRRTLFSEMLVHVRLVARALSGWPHPPYHAAVPEAARPSAWRAVLQWVNPIRAWRELRDGGASRGEIAAGLAAGAFVGNTPAWGFHTFISLWVARRLHLHPLAVVAGSHVSAPPVGPFLIAAAMWIGHVIIHRNLPVWHNLRPPHGKLVAGLLPFLADWAVGAPLVGAALAIGVFIVANFLLRGVERNARGARETGAPSPTSPQHST